MAQQLDRRGVKTVPRSRRGKSFVACDQSSPFRQSRGEVKAVVDRLIEVEGDGLGGGDVAAPQAAARPGPLGLRQAPLLQDPA